MFATMIKGCPVVIVLWTTFYVSEDEKTIYSHGHPISPKTSIKENNSDYLNFFKLILTFVLHTLR